MTEYELLNASQGQANILLTNLTNTFSIMTAYLVVGYFAAHRISRAMALFVTALFVLWCIQSLMLGLGSTLVLLNIVAEMRAEAHAGKAFLWWPALAKPSVGFDLIVVYAAFAMVIAASIGSIYFFFECRSRNMRAEATLPPPSS